MPEDASRGSPSCDSPASRRTRQLHWWAGGLAAILLSAQLAALGRFQLSGDEAFYWLYSRHLDWGYLTNTPLVGWLIAAGTAVFGHTPFAVRFPFWIAGVASVAGLYFWGRYCAGPQAGPLAYLCLLLVPMAWLLGVMANPDAPLLASWIWSAYCLQRGLDGGGRRWWLLGGACAGLGILAKYTFGLLPLAVLAILLRRGERRWWRRWEPYGAALLAGLVCSPYLAWLIARRFEPISLRVGIHGVEAAPLDTAPLLHFLLSQSVVWSPCVLALSLWAAAGVIRRREPRLAVAATSCVVPLAAFLLYALGRHVHPHWTGVAVPGAVVCLASTLAARPIRRARVALLVTPSALLLALAVIFAAGARGFLPLPSDVDDYLASVSDWSPGGGAQLAETVAREIEELQQVTGVEPLLAGSHSYHTISRIAWELGRDDRLIILEPGGVVFQLDEWYRADWKGRPVVLVLSRSLPWFPLAAYFESCGPPAELRLPSMGGERRYQIYRCTGFRGRARGLEAARSGPPAQDLADRLYRAILDREPDTVGRRDALEALGRGDLVHLACMMATSEERAQRLGGEDIASAVRRVYSELRGTPPPPARLEELTRVARWAGLSGAVVRLLAEELETR